MENPIKMDDLGVPLFLETSICTYKTGVVVLPTCNVSIWHDMCLTFRPTNTPNVHVMCAFLNLFPQDSKLHHINLMALKAISSTFNYFHFNLSPNYRSSSPPATTAQPRNSSIHCGGRVWWTHSLRTSVSQICYGMTQFYKTISTFNQKLHDMYNIIAWCYFCIQYHWI